MIRKRTLRRLTAVTGVFFIMLGASLPVLGSLFPGVATAAAGPVETIVGGRTENTFFDPFNPGSVFNKITCQGVIETATMSQQMVLDSMGITSGNLNSAIEIKNAGGSPNVFGFNTPVNFSGSEYTKYLLNRIGKEVNVLKLYQAQPSPSADACGSLPGAGAPHYTMLPICAAPGPNGSTCGDNDDVTVWAVHQLVTGGNSYDISYFVKTGDTATGIKGNFKVYQCTDDDGCPAQKEVRNVEVSGAPVPTTDPQVNINGLSGEFKDVATIDITFTLDGQEVHERYVDRNWDQLSFYFLESTDNDARRGLTFSARSVDIRHRDPLCEPGNNQTPYIWVKSGDNGGSPTCDDNARNANNLIFDRPQDDFKRRIGEMVSFQNNVFFMNYNADGTYVQTTDSRYPGTPAAVPFGGAIRKSLANVWFYMNNDRSAITTAWASGDNNESNYVGLYNFHEESQYYRHQASDCGLLGQLQSPADLRTATGPLITTNWTLIRPNTGCQENYVTNAGVRVAVDDVRFNEISGIVNDTGSTGDVTDVARLNCEVSFNPLTWIMCPIIAGAQAMVEQLDNAVNKLLTINVNQYFDETCSTPDSGTPCNGARFYQAWSAIRVLATAIIIIAALVMVIAQAAGVEILSPYAFKKMAPAAAFAIIIMPLSWDLSKAAISLSEVLGLGIRNIIYAPFAGSTGAVQIDSGTSSALALVAGATLLTLGLFATLSFALTAALAVLVAFGVLVFREVAIIFLTITSPLAAAFYIMPATRKIAKLWWDNFWRMLLLFLIIMLIIAIGRVFASVTASTGELFNQIVAFAAYFGSYAAIVMAPSWAGSAMSAVTGFGKNLGAFAALKKFRSNALHQRGDKWRSGSLFRENRLTRPLNALGRSVGAAQTGAGIAGFLPTRRGRAARALYDSQLHDRALKNNPLLAELANDDDANNVLGMSGGSLAGMEQAAFDLFGSSTSERARRAMAAARAVGVNRQNALAAARTSMQNKARGFTPGNVRALDRGMRRLARNGDEYQSFSQQMAFFARSSGRADLGGTEWIDWERSGAGWQQARATSNDEMAQWRVIADRNMLDGASRTTVQAMEAGHDSQAAQYARTFARILRTAPEGSDARLQAAIHLKELQGGLAGATGGTRDELNAVLYASQAQGGLGLNPAENVAEALAAMVRRPGVDGTTITTLGRVYPEYNPREGAPQP